MNIIRLALFFAAVLFLPSPSGAESVSVSDAGDQTTVEVTVYNNNLGLIKDVRTVTLPSGEGELRFMDVASHIQPATVLVQSVRPSSGFTVLEQNYEYDLMNARKLLDKYVGKQIKIVDWNRFQDRKDVVEATLLANNEGQVYRIGEEIFLGHPGVKVLPELPGDLIAKPTLTWRFRNGYTEPQKLRVSYLTENIGWRADYVLLLNDDDTMADLSGWVTLDNRSGAAYRNARLKLVAGEVHRATPEPPGRDPMFQAKAMAEAEGFREEAFFEYHLYDLDRPTTIKDLQTKQIRLLEASGLGVTKELLVTSPRGFFNRRLQGPSPRQPVAAFLSFANKKENRLGRPLPAGIVRVYKEDSRGSRQFIGEDRIAHIPTGETVRLKTGESFDVVAERTQTDFKQVTRGRYETAWDVTLRNHKEEAVRVGVVERLTGHWKILTNSHDYRKVDAFSIRFDVSVPPDGETTVRYRVQVGL